MADILSRKETALHRVEFYQRKRWLVCTFGDPEEAYRFWLSLRRGIQAVLYQNGQRKASGNGLESN